MTGAVARAAIGVGSNVGDPAANVRTALARLADIGIVRAASSLYRTRAWGVTDQPDFFNAAALVDTRLEPHALLAALKALESELGRVATFRWGPRVIDLDILTYGDLRLDDPALTIPHARLHERAFALAPLAEIDPSYEAALAALDPAARAEAVRLEPGPA